MYLKNLHLRQFRNYQDQKVEFTAAKTILVGNNAQGKSNLLEAVELLATLRSHRMGRDRDFIQEGQDIAQINATLERENGTSDLALTLRRNGRRSVAINGESVRRQMDFLGVLNAVQFSSLDLDLVRGGPDIRRNWLDTLLIQLEPIYAHILQQYNQVLRQRNAFLRKSLDSAGAMNRNQAGVMNRNQADAMNRNQEDAMNRNQEDAMNRNQEDAMNRVSTRDSTLAIWDAQLVNTGTKVIRRRDRAIQRLAPIAAAWHSSISGSTEVLKINYLPSVSLAETPPEEIQAAFLAKIQQRSAAEFYRGTTLVGPHRDEVELMINQTPARQYGSQGQQRTLVLALKLAELELIEQVVQEPPLLLLDDVLAELDPFRQNQLLDAIQDRFQTLITTTHLSSFDAQWLNSSQILYVKSGEIVS